MLVEWQFHLTGDTLTGGATAYLLKMDPDNDNWQWVADTEFGPFDTTQDITTWLHRQLIKHAPRRLR
jgi:hypothetical protein